MSEKVIRIGGSWAMLFLAAWTLMLIAGSLLGDKGLWTPAYWEIFWALYGLSSLTSFITYSVWNFNRTVEGG